ncbi:hypothetical protein DICPUDRAFT_94352 [Dictyostelium purpureum]|uniref:NEDD8-activating enzyme E1 regulatory subunit n=1 Tax=Dictyostelium purpureum TaxID=5786 RepID=F0ZIG4_DICPU|nr:uncharacterized protein DICPUDRAFT_94352 [Dictyostelium purpureum]EGC36255.1 hypothetical protein DICPUDRAFT_94352 [Dictyostelium purpureum]|eukprot:XP_003287201.1 hypothetical protein DICPUDRAFT_94352 [Dictyostelium purpureum]
MSQNNTTTTDTDKYDRQLRLWGEDGQSKLEKSHILLLNGNATGCETLKNLVLPGIGSFTIVDNKKVVEQDLGNNFFVERSSIGKPRASVVCELLRELNDRVKGSSVEECPVHLINNNISFFKDFSLVIASRLPEPALLTLSQYLFEKNIPLAVVNSYGYIGYLRISTPEHQIIESKPDDPIDDLRIYNPFQQLVDQADALDLKSLDSQKHSHVPYVLLLIKFLKEWRSTHDNKMPESRAEKEEFKKIFISKSLDYSDEKNFIEGVNNLLKYVQPPRIPGDVQNLLKDAKASNITETMDDFWVLVSALKDFVEKNDNTLPLHGNVPDMTSDTESFIKLQKAYQEKSQADLTQFTNLVDQIVTKTGRSSISPDLIKKFCKNSRFLNIIRYRSISDEFSQPKTKMIISELEQQDNIMIFYTLLRGVDKFFNNYHRYPGSNDEDYESDISLLKNVISQFLSEINIPVDLVKDDYINEFVRFGGSELHNIASLMGGVTSQEIIKLVTHQYVPLNNTFIFNGINSTTASFNL